MNPYRKINGQCRLRSYSDVDYVDINDSWNSMIEYSTLINTVLFIEFFTVKKPFTGGNLIRVQCDHIVIL